MIACLLAGVLSLPAARAQPLLDARIGVLANRGAEHALAQRQPTADYLGSRVPGYRFLIVPLSFEAIAPAVQAGRVDYVLANPAVYVGLERAHGVSAIATLKNSLAGREYAVFGGAIFTRADAAGLDRLEDLRGKRFMAVDATSLGGYLAALRELLGHGIRPQELGSLGFGGTHDKVVAAVLAGRADAGTVRTDILERMATEGSLRLDRIRLLAPADLPVAEFPFRHSTRLYPEWPFAKLAHTPYGVAEKVATALLAMTPDSAAARAAECAGWTVPLSYASVHALLRELALPPYEPAAAPTWHDTLRQYRNQLMVAAALLLGSWLLLAHIARINRRLQASRDQLDRLNARLQEEMAEQEALNQRLLESQSQLLQADKMASIGLLAAGVAHEINTPIGYITTNIGALEGYGHQLGRLLAAYDQAAAGLPADDPARLRLEAAKAAIDPAFLREDSESLIAETRQGLDRVRRIVQGLREFSHPDDAQWEWADLNKGLEDTLTVAHGELKHGIQVVRDYGPLPLVRCRPQQINQVFLNLVLNAIHAMAGKGTLTLRSRRLDDRVLVEVEDSGCGIDAAHLEHIFDPFFTTKPVGLGTGLGLSICSDIVQKHQGRIEVTSVPGAGATFRVVLPIEPAV
jgi:two-component system sensor histidine kinase TtrS